MQELHQIEFFQLRKVREKKFSNRLRRVYNNWLNDQKEFQQKVKLIKHTSQRIDAVIKK